MRLSNKFHNQPLKRNDSFNHNRDLAISIGGARPIAFGHPLRYFLNRIKLGILRQYQRSLHGVQFFVMDTVIGHLFLAGYLTRSIVLPRDFAGELSLAKVWRNWGWGLKRAMDIAGSFVGLILLIPLFVIIAIMIKLDSSGPIFYSQIRVGINRRRAMRRQVDCIIGADRRGRERRRQNNYGKLFMVYKFRTMIDNAEKKCGPIWATENDPRITRVGAFLRRMRLDELPQLFNVLKGDMSLIGPRPERPMFIRDLSQRVPHYTARLEVKPGITGLAQVENGYDVSIDSVRHKIAYDLRYIKSWSLWQDIKILLKTVIVVITGKGAF